MIYICVIYLFVFCSQLFYWVFFNQVKIIKVDYFLKSSQNVAITFYPFIFLDIKKTANFSKEDFKKLLFHEYTHVKQQKELLFIFAYFFYLLEWLIKRDYNKISFEKEACYYALTQNQKELENRKLFNFIKYI